MYGAASRHRASFLELASALFSSSADCRVQTTVSAGGGQSGQRQVQQMSKMHKPEPVVEALVRRLIGLLGYATAHSTFQWAAN